MRAFWLTAAVVLVDQAAKFAVVRTMHIGQSIPLVGDWLKLTFTENPGMAFGITFGPKGLVTGLALIATILISFYLYRLRDHYAPYRYSLALILGGAIGNIIDRLFYGVLYEYGSFFTGRVVDFIHVDLWRGYVQEVFPFVGGEPWAVALFPIWNVADMAIVIGVVGILLFQGQFHEEIQARRRERSAAADSSTEVSVDASSQTSTNGEATTVRPSSE